MSNALELFSLVGKTAVVTGAGGLLGHYHCKALTDAGALVVACDIERERCAAVVDALDGDIHSWAADVTDPESVQQLLTHSLAHTGQVDILVNNAAINDKMEDPQDPIEISGFEDYPLDKWKQSIDVNITGVFVCSQVIGTKMARQGTGSIINIASTYGIVAPDQSLYKDPQGRQKTYKSPAYVTTKGAVIAFTRFLASYWGRAGVRVNTLSPGGVENAQDSAFIHEYSRRTPLGRMALPGDYMGALLFLASDASAYTTGTNLVVDGGFTIW